MDADRLATLLAEGGFRGPQPILVESTGSTNADVAGLDAEGAADFTCVQSQEQVSGRGRLSRTWESPSGAGLWCSILVPVAGLTPSWIPLAAGLAACDAITGIDVRLKWPNDLVVVGPDDTVAKLGGILVELLPSGRAVVGIGINVAIAAEEIPFPGATSVLSEGGDLDRTELLAHLLVALQHRMAQWVEEPEALRADYLSRCTTIGRLVRAYLPDGTIVSGIAEGIDVNGALLLNDGESVRTIAAGDVVHATI